MKHLRYPGRGLYAFVLAELVLSPLISQLRGAPPKQGALAARGISSVVPLGGPLLCGLGMLFTLWALGF